MSGEGEAKKTNVGPHTLLWCRARPREQVAVEAACMERPRGAGDGSGSRVTPDAREKARQKALRSRSACLLCGTL